MPAPSLDGVTVTNDLLDAVSSWSVSRTTAGSNRVGFVSLAGQIFSGTPGITATWDGVAMTQVYEVFRGWECTALFYIINPPTGSVTVAMSFPNSAYGRAIAWCMQDAHQTTPIGTAATAFGTSSAPSVSVTSATGETVVGTLGATSADPAETGTLIAEGARAGSIWGSAQYYTGASSVSVEWTGSQTSWACGGVPVKPASGRWILGTH